MGEKPKVGDEFWYVSNGYGGRSRFEEIVKLTRVSDKSVSFVLASGVTRIAKPCGGPDGWSRLRVNGSDNLSSLHSHLLPRSPDNDARGLAYARTKKAEKVQQALSRMTAEKCLYVLEIDLIEDILAAVARAGKLNMV